MSFSWLSRSPMDSHQPGSKRRRRRWQAARKEKRRSQRHRLAGFESLEDRRLLAASYSINNGGSRQIIVDADAKDIRIRVDKSAAAQRIELFSAEGFSGPCNVYISCKNTGGTSNDTIRFSQDRYGLIDISDAGHVTFIEGDGPNYRSDITIESQTTEFQGLSKFDASARLTIDSSESITLSSGSSIDSGGDVTLNGNTGIVIQDNSGITSSNGDITLIGDSMSFASSSAITAPSYRTVAIRPETSGHLIGLGLFDSVTTLGLKDAELDVITAGTVEIGDVNSGAITVSGTGYEAISHNNSLTLTSGAGITFNKALTLIADKDLMVRASDTIELNLFSALATSGGGEIKLETLTNISLMPSSSITTVDGRIVLEANHEANLTGTVPNFDGIKISRATVEATGTGSIEMKAAAGNLGLYGINIIGFADPRSIVRTTSGNLSIQGATKDTADSRSVNVENSAVETSSGLITINGTGADRQSSHGVRIRLSDITTATGSIDVTGKASGDGAHGVTIQAGSEVAVTGAGGELSIEGAGGKGQSDGAKGVSLLFTSSVVSSGSLIHIVGKNENTNTIGGNYGVDVDGNSSIIASGSNTSLRIAGTGGLSTSGNNHGVYLLGDAQTVNGLLSITGTAGSGGSSLSLGSTSEVTTTGTGAVTLIGNSMSLGGTIDAGTRNVTVRPSTNERPIYLGATGDTGSILKLSNAELNRITAGAIIVGNSSYSGDVTFTGSVQLVNVDVLIIETSGTVEDEDSGDVTALSGTSNLGLLIRAKGVGTTTNPLNVAIGIFGAEVGSGGINLDNNQNLDIDGLGFLGGLGANSSAITVAAQAIDVYDDILSGGGNINLTGTDYITIHATKKVNAGNGEVSLSAPSLDLHGNVLSGTVRLEPKTAGEAIDLGGPGTAGNFVLTNTELDQFTAGRIIVGAATAGDVTFTGAVSLPGKTLEIVTAGRVNGTGTATAFTGSKLAISADQGIGTTSPLNVAVSNFEANGGSGGIDVMNSGAVTIGDVNDGLPGLNTTNSRISLTASGTITITSSEAIDSGGGNILLTASGTTSAITSNALLDSSGDNTGGNVSLTAANGVTLAAGNVTTGGGTFNINADSDANGAGTYLQNAGSGVATADGEVFITGADIDLQGAGTDIDAGSAAVSLIPSAAGRTIDLGAPVGGEFVLTSEELGRITSGKIIIGADDAGDLTFTGGGVITNDTLEVVTAGTVNDTTDTTVFTGSKLAISADLGVGTTSTLNINVSNLEADGGSGGIDVTNNTKALTIGGVSNALDGLRATSSGDITITTIGNSSSIAANEPLTTAGGAISLTTGSGVMLSGAAVTTAGGTFTVDAGTGTYSQSVAVTTNDANVSITAKTVNLSGTIDAGTADVTLKPAGTNPTIDLGAGGSGAFVLSNDTLAQITAGGVIVGTTGASDVRFTAPVSLDSLEIRTGGSVIAATGLETTTVFTGTSLAINSDGVGSTTDPLQIAVSNLEANGGDGGIYISNTGSLNIGGFPQA